MTTATNTVSNSKVNVHVPSKNEGVNSMFKAIEVSNQMQKDVFKIMVELIEAKGFRNRMITCPDIYYYFRSKDWQVPSRVVSAILDSMIRFKDVRFFSNPEGDIYFGLTKKAWVKWDAHKSTPAVEVADQENVVNMSELPVDLSDIPDEWSGESAKVTKTLTKKQRNAIDEADKLEAERQELIEMCSREALGLSCKPLSFKQYRGGNNNA